MVGSIGGVALAWKRLDAVRSNRRAELNALLAGAGSSAEKRLTLLDRADALSVDGRARLAEIAAVGGLSTASVCGIVIGAVTHSGVACVLGAALAFLPAAVLAQRYVAHHERRDVSKLLHGIDDPWPGQ